MESPWFGLWIIFNVYLKYIAATAVFFIVFFLKQKIIHKKLRLFIIGLITCLVVSKITDFIISMVMGMILSNESIAGLGYWGFVLPKLLAIILACSVTLNYIINFLCKE